MTISGQKQLRPCPIGERAATVERMVLTKFRRSDDSPYGSLCGGSYCWSSQEMRKDGSPARNAPKRLPQSTNDSGACTSPTSRSRANLNSASPSATSNTQKGRVHRLPNTHRLRSQSPIRWNCVQLKQHKQCESSMTRTGPSLLKSKLPNEEWTRSDTGNFLVRPAELRKQLRVLLGIPSSPWLGIKTWNEFRSPQEFRNHPKNAQTMPLGYESGNSMTQPSFPKREN